jgi:tetratricopeptide (TPR) repeat protein
VTHSLCEHKRFLEKALLSYEEFAADTGQNEESRAGVAHAYGRVAFIRNQLGQLKESEAAWLRCRELYSALSADFPAVVDYRQKQAKVDIMLCILYRQTRRVDLAEAFINRALNIYRQLRSEIPEDPDHRFGEAASLDHLGVVLKNLTASRGRGDLLSLWPCGALFK